MKLLVILDECINHKELAFYPILTKYTVIDSTGWLDNYDGDEFYNEVLSNHVTYEDL